MRRRDLYWRIRLELWVLVLLLSSFAGMIGYGIGAVREWRACVALSDQR